MPFLRVLEEDGQRSEGAPGNVIAAMLFPKCRATQQLFQAAASVDGVGYWEETAEVFPPLAGLSRALARACEQRLRIAGGLRVFASSKPGPREMIDHAMRQEAVYGQAAGQMLLFMLAHDKAMPGQASVRTARRIVTKFAGKSEKWGPRRVGAKEDFWSHYRGVAHLWAVYTIREKEKIRLGQGNLLEALNGRNLEPFLADAEHLRAEAELLPRHGDERPLMPPDEQWRAPEMALPPPTANIPPWTQRNPPPRATVTRLRMRLTA